MKKNIAVFFSEPGMYDYPYNKPEYFESYKLLASEIESLGAKFYIVRSNSTYSGDGHFTKSWQFVDGDIVDTGAVKVDSIYDKGRFISDHKVFVLNRDEVSELCTDKWKTYQTLTEFCPETILVNNELEFQAALKKISTTKKVIKPVDGEEGNGVFIGDEEYLSKQTVQFPMLVQEFLDTSSGIPNIYVGIHDLRITYINGEIVYSFFRTPPPGKLLANVAQGGSLTIVNPTKLPKSVFAISELIKSRFKNDYCFSVDLGFVDGVPKIIELNSRPALFHPKRGAEFEKFIKKIAYILVHPSN